MINKKTLDFRPHPIDGSFPSPKICSRFEQKKPKRPKKKCQKRWTNKENAEFRMRCLKKKGVEQRKGALDLGYISAWR